MLFRCLYTTDVFQMKCCLTDVYVWWWSPDMCECNLMLHTWREPLDANPTALMVRRDFLHCGVWTGQKVRLGFMLYIISSFGAKDHFCTWKQTNTLNNRIETTMFKKPHWRCSLTLDSLGWRTSVSGSTVRTLWSDPQSLHLNSTGTLLRFFTRSVRSEQEPSAVGWKNRLPPSTLM